MVAPVPFSHLPGEPQSEEEFSHGVGSHQVDNAGGLVPARAEGHCMPSYDYGPYATRASVLRNLPSQDTFLSGVRFLLLRPLADRSGFAPAPQAVTAEPATRCLKSAAAFRSRSKLAPHSAHMYMRSSSSKASLTTPQAQPSWLDGNHGSTLTMPIPARFALHSNCRYISTGAASAVDRANPARRRGYMASSPLRPSAPMSAVMVEQKASTRPRRNCRRGSGAVSTGAAS